MSTFRRKKRRISIMIIKGKKKKVQKFEPALKEGFSPVVKHKENRVHKVSKLTLAKLFFLFMAPTSLALFPSCQSTVYTLNPGTRSVLQDTVTPAEKAEWDKYVNTAIPRYSDAYTNNAVLDAVDMNIEMPITMRNNSVDMAMNVDFYNKYSDECDWCYRYIKEIFSVIAPDAKINMKVINNAIDENTFFSPHIIAYSEHNYEDSAFLGATNKHLGVSVKDGDKATISSNVMMNSKFEDKFTEQSAYFRKAMLHETLHAFGLNHLEEGKGGNIMTANCADSVTPLMLSPAEMEKMIGLYSTRSESFLNVFMNWYRRQYDNCVSYSVEHYNEYKDADPATRSQIVLENTINVRDFFKVFKQYEDSSSINM